TLGASIMAGLVFGFLPALRAVRSDLGGTLAQAKADGLAGAFRITHARGALVVAQVAFTLVLLASAGLLMRSFQQLSAVEPGFDTERVVSLGMVLPGDVYPTAPDRVTFVDRARQAIGRLPGVEAVAVTNFVPLGGMAGQPSRLEVDGRDPADPAARVEARELVASTGYFEALGLPPRSGRFFGPGDDAEAPAVVVVNRTFAERTWPGRDPLGQRLRPAREADTESDAPPWATVVGVVDDIRQDGPAEPVPPVVYRAYAQQAWSYLNLIVRHRGDAAEAIREARQAVWQLDPGRPFFDVSSFEDRRLTWLKSPRFSAYLTGLVSTFALVLASLGLYSVLAYSVSQRVRELGVRMALGASRAQVRRLVVGQGLRLTLLGLAIGLAASAAATRLLASQLHGVTPGDATTFVLVSTLLLAAAYLAIRLPADRASRIEPVVALRDE
ncbi:MAG: ABC transporter permease, partial [Holophagales bacterium]|nr:ABC transporter permease [Holophagales bacterium]